MKKLSQVIWGIGLSWIGLAAMAATPTGTTSPQLLLKSIAVHPACIARFLPTNPDGTVSDSLVNLAMCQKINQNKKVTINSQGFATYNTTYGGMFGYQLVGQTSSGSYVLRSFNSGGGSGVFDNLFVISVKPDTLVTQSIGSPTSEQTLVYLKLERVISVGDRCLSGIATVSVQGDTINLTQYQGQTAVDCSKTRNITINM
ncbi:MAG: hypothetical protein ACK4PR_03210 [Gammaproteobacteria bacterium]